MGKISNYKTFSDQIILCYIIILYYCLTSRAGLVEVLLFESEDSFCIIKRPNSC